MAASNPDDHLTLYVINYFGGFMNEPEWLAYRAFLAEEKAKRYESPEEFEEFQTTDPGALALMTEGRACFFGEYEIAFSAIIEIGYFSTTVPDAAD